MLFRAVLHQEHQRKALARATIYGDFVDDAAGNRFYQYDMEQAKAGLLKKAALSETSTA
jgi:hypothetical protein